VSQLASLGQQVTSLMQALEDERDETCRSLPVRNPGALQRWYDATDAAATKVQALASGIGGSFPADIKAKVAAVHSAITGLGQQRDAAQTSTSALFVIADYTTPINAIRGIQLTGVPSSEAWPGKVRSGRVEPTTSSHDVQLPKLLRLREYPRTP
jgi:hypothetical protein